MENRSNATFWTSLILHINFPRNLKEVVREPKEFEEIQSEETGWRPTWGSVAWSESIRGWRVRVYMWLEFEWLAGIMEARLLYLFCLFYLLTFKCRENHEKTMDNYEIG